MNPTEARIFLKVASAASTGAGNTDVAFRPEAGEIWEVLAIVGYQDDGAVWNYWLWTDAAVTASEIGRKQATAAYDYLVPFSNNNNPQSVAWFGPLVVSYKSFPTYRFVASAASKNGTVKALVRRYLGMDEP